MPSSRWSSESIIDTPDKLENCLGALESEIVGVIAVDCETEPFDFKNPLKSHSWQLELEGVGFYTQGVGYYVTAECLRSDERGLRRRLDKVLASKVLVMHNSLFDLTVLEELGFKTSDWNVHDTKILSWLHDENRESHGLKQLSASILGETSIVKFKDLKEKPENPEELKQWIHEMGSYCIEDCRHTLELFNLFYPALSPELLKAYAKMELPVVRVVQKMERDGILLDEDYLRGLDTKLGESIKRLVDSIREEAEEPEINLGSTKQLRELLYSKRGYQVTEMTPKGVPSTSSETLEGLSKIYNTPFLADLVRHRELTKIKGTYTEGLLRQAVGGVIHGSLNSVGTHTGRFSSSNPNLQQIPRATEFDIRKAFIARPGHTFVISDYSQVELRLVAWLSNDKSMLKAFEEGKDIHQATADLLGVSRTYAKTVNFGIIYGKTAWGLARELKITEDEAEKFLADYFKQFPGVKKFMDSAGAQLKAQGYVETMTKRKRRFPDYQRALKSQNWSWVHRMERQAGNSIVQGSAADVAKLAMLKLHKILPTIGGKLLLTIHDEFVVEVPEEGAESHEKLVRETMENAVDLKSVKLVAESKVSKHWKK